VNTHQEVDGAAVVATYFEDRVTEAEKKVEEARAALAEAEAAFVQKSAERAAFAADGLLHPAAYNSPTGQPEWELCAWASTRIGRIAFKDMTAAGDRAYERLMDEQRAAHAWLRAHGYTVPDEFEGQA
jgi:hypothetical protein